MLMFEVASAADTLELWKLINDNVWAALQKMQRDENERMAAQRRSAAQRVPSKRSAKPKAMPTATPQPPKPPTQQSPQQQKQDAVQSNGQSAPVQQRTGLQPQNNVAAKTAFSL